MRRRLALLALLVAAGLAPGAAAKPGTLSGKLTAAPSGHGFMRAVRATDGAVVAATPVGSSGAWKLKLGAGWYLPIASVVGDDKRRTTAVAPLERVRAGRTTRTKFPLRRGARAAATAPPTVGIKVFTATGPNTQLGKGLTDMLITEMSNTASGDCKPVIVEVEHRKELLKEIALANSRFIDPRSRIRNRLIDPATYVEGTVTTTADSTSWELKVVDAKTGDVLGGDSGSAAGTDIFDAPADIAKSLTEQLCGVDYHALISIDATITIPPYNGNGIVTADVPVLAVAGQTPPRAWSGLAAAVFGGLQYGGVDGCTIDAGTNTGSVNVDIARSTAPDLIQVTWGGQTNSILNLICRGASIPNGVPPIQPFQGTNPTTFVMPASGGTQSLSGGLGTAGGAWVNTGTITVTRVARSP